MKIDDIQYSITKHQILMTNTYWTWLFEDDLDPYFFNLSSPFHCNSSVENRLKELVYSRVDSDDDFLTLKENKYKRDKGKVMNFE